MIKTILRLVMVNMFCIGTVFAQEKQPVDMNAWKQHVGKAGPSGWRVNVIQPDPENHGPDGFNYHDWDGDGDLDVFVNFEEGGYSRLYFNPGKDKIRDLWTDYIELEKHGVELVACLGFLSPFELRSYEGRAINVHPALIPAFSGKGFYGRRVHEAVLAKGVKLTGATVHFIDAEYDHGPIILQRAVPVQQDDTPETLAARVQAVERELVPEAIRLYAEGRLEIVDHKVRVREPQEGPPGRGPQG